MPIQAINHLGKPLETEHWGKHFIVNAIFLHPVYALIYFPSPYLFDTELPWQCIFAARSLQAITPTQVRHITHIPSWPEPSCNPPTPQRMLAGMKNTQGIGWIGVHEKERYEHHNFHAGLLAQFPSPDYGHDSGDEA